MSILRSFLVCAIFLPASLFAQAEVTFDDDARQSYKAVSNLFVALSVDDSLSAGTYRFKADEPGDGSSEIDLVKYGMEFAVTDENASVVPLLQISPSYLKFEGDADQVELDVESKGLGLGAGLRFRLFEKKLTLTPRFKVDYSEIDYDFDIVGADDSLVDSIIPDLEVWSYIPSLEAEYRHSVTDNLALFFNSQLSFVYLYALTSEGTTDDFRSKSWIVRNTFFWEMPLSKNEKSIVVRPKLARVDVHGAARDGFGFNNFYEGGVELVSKEIFKSLFSEIGVGAAYVYEKEVQGWRFGLFGSFS